MSSEHNVINQRGYSLKWLFGWLPIHSFFLSSSLTKSHFCVGWQCVPMKARLSLVSLISQKFTWPASGQQERTVSFLGGSFVKPLLSPEKRRTSSGPCFSPLACPHLCWLESPCDAMSYSCYPEAHRSMPKMAKQKEQPQTSVGLCTAPLQPWAASCRTVSPLRLSHHHRQIPIFLLHATEGDPNQYIHCFGRPERLNEMKCPN